ncbi:hypothetical protein DFH09DRAFT_918771 [Mycena vulgaris]|nr:hypothetical protein DFH09DRAFT_918771 [Mycena vulgaris]
MALVRSICLILGALSAARTVASIPWPAGNRSLRLGLALVSRQSSISDVPPQCASSCDPIITILELPSCAPEQCCAGSFQLGYFNCLKCVGLAFNVTAAGFVQPQTLIDGALISCSKEGFPLPELTFPGQNPNRTLATLSGSHSAQSTRSQITISALPSDVLATTSNTISQKTVTALPTPSAAGPTTATTATPTQTSTGAAVSHIARLDMVVLSLMVAGWMML